jgi:hypothetical protein
MSDDGIPLRHEQTDRLLTTFIDTYNSIFPSRQSFDPWADLWAKDAEWTLPIDRKSPAHGGIGSGKGGVDNWAKETAGSPLRERKFVEKWRIIQGHVVAREGTWEAATTRPEQAATLPLVMTIEFNEEGKVKSRSS